MNNYINQIRNNLKKLVIFELFYKTFFLLFIFPIIKYLFNLSIYYLGLDYLRNQTLLFYFTKPSTIILIMFILLILTIYTSFEILTLSIIIRTDSNQKSDIFSLLKFSLLKYISILKNKQFYIPLSMSILVLLVEFYHIIGVGNFIHVPLDLSRFIFSNILFSVLFIMMLLLISYLIISLVKKILINQNNQVYNKPKLNQAIKELVLFLILNFSLNILFFILYDGSYLLLNYAIDHINLTVTFKAFLFAITNTITVIYIILATILLVPLNLLLINSFIIYKPYEIHQVSLIKNNKIRYSILSLVILIFLTFQVYAMDFELKNEFIEHDIIVAAHRGYSSKAPENTLAAIELAVLNQVSAIEFDVRLTKDLIPVLLHDETLGRTTNDSQNRKLRDLTLSEVKELDAGLWFDSSFTGEKIPTLAEVLNKINQYNQSDQFSGVLFVELKDNDAILDQMVLNLLNAQSLLSSSYILSFSYDQLVRIKTMNPNAKTTLLVSSFYGDPFHLINLNGVDHFGLSMNFIDDNYDLIHILQKNNKKVFVWTVDDQKNIKKYADLNVNGIITNEVELAIETLNNHVPPKLDTIILKKYYMRKHRLLDIE
jgi:glycerophosphoryl diester phosphodiesterase